MISKAPESGNSIQLQKVLKKAAVAGAIFSLVFLTMLIINGYQQYVSGVNTYSVITELKQQLLSQPDDEALIREIRELDRDYRAGRLRQIDFSALSSLMLLISAIVTIGALKWHAYSNGINPGPCIEIAEPFRRRSLGQSRIALFVFACLLTGTWLLIERNTPTEWISQLNAGISEEPEYASIEELARNWNRFRGFGGAGVTPLTDIPTRWDAAGGKGILWKTAIPLPGFNSPIAWQDRIFLSGANEGKRQVYCFDASSGSILWTGDVPTAPVGDKKFKVMEDTGYAAPTMATDGVRVYVIFATGDLAAFDFSGRLLWHKSLGIPVSLYGYASSLEVWKDRVLVQFDQAGAEDKKSSLYAFDGATGNLVWEAKRPVPNSWTSPLVVPIGDKYQLITVGDPWVIAYDPEDGKEIWRANCVKGDVGASSILAGDRIIAIAPDLHNVAIRTDGAGDVTATHIAWMNDDVGPTIVSPVSDGRRVYFLDTYGTLYAVNIEDGQLIYEHDFNENTNASPTLVAGKLYVLSVEGIMFTGTLDEKGFNLEESNALNEKCFASPAFMPGRIYIRGEEHLYCIGNGNP
ncbi:MAG: PQQ-like beta-propeller repeat protein [Deltaproteobacteria bacterium]|nr:PQQ-like beta-propeller repeat protein [Deltaproteobacteria bacterium]